MSLYVCASAQKRDDANNCLEQIIPMMNEIADISIENIKYTLDL